MAPYNALLPEIFLFLSSCFLLFLKHKDKISIFCIFGALILLIAGYKEVGTGTGILNDLVFISKFSQSVKVIILGLSLVFFMQLLSVRQRYDNQFSTIALFSVIGAMLVASSGNLLSIYLALELQSIPMYVLAAIDKKSVKSSEAGIKYFTLGMLSSAVMLYGISLVYNVAGALDFGHVFTFYSSLHLAGLILFCAGLLFKLAVVPFHGWIADVYEGSPTISLAFFTVVSKVSTVAVLFAIFAGFYNQDYFRYLSKANSFSSLFEKPFLVLGCISLFFGAFAAIKQKNFKRLLAFASVVHMGYVLVGIASVKSAEVFASPIFYVVIYSITGIGLTSFALLLKSFEIKNLGGFGLKDKFLGVALSVLLLSSAGIPPFAGFFAKLYVIQELLRSGYIFVGILSVLAGVLSAFYYLRMIKIMYFDKEEGSLDLQENSFAVFLIIFIALVLSFPFVLFIA